MASIENKQQVLAWIEDGCEWNKGLILYSMYGKNQMLLKNISNKQSSQSGKLIYELCKSVGIDYLKMKSMGQIPEVKPTEILKQHQKIRTIGQNPPKEVKQVMVEIPETIAPRNMEQYPATIRRVITEYAEIFQERGKTHRIMVEMPEGNSQVLKTKRAELFDIIKGFSARLEYLYDVRTVFDQTGFVPAEDEIWPKQKEKVKTELPDDPELLRKMKKNQQSANTKDQSMLDYQSEKQGEVKKPMPNGPKRIKLENRIKARLKLIEAIEYKLLNI